MKQEIRIPSYSTCKVCCYFWTDLCQPCLTESDTTHFQPKRGLTLDDLPPFPRVDFSDGMPVRMRQAIVGLYMEKMVERAQGLR